MNGLLKGVQMSGNKAFKISVHEVIGGDAAISAADGDLLFQRLRKALAEKRDIEVDFANIALIVSSFLNAAFGQLLSEFSEETVNQHLRWTNLGAEDRELMSRVISRAKLYFKDRKNFSMAISEDIEDDN